MSRCDSDLGIHHRDGIPWHQAPLPHRWHHCEIQTSSISHGVLRCACGAVASLLGPWQEKNSRRSPWWRFGR